MSDKIKNRFEMDNDKFAKTEERNLKNQNEEINVNNVKHSNPYITENQKDYTVLKYLDNCEEHNQISFIIPLIKSKPKFILYIILNILTVGLINLFIAWFPKLVLYIYYKVTDLEEATHLGVF